MRLTCFLTSYSSLLFFEYFVFSYDLIISQADDGLKGNLFFRYVFFRKLQRDFTNRLNISQLFTDCAASFLTEGDAIQPDVFPIIIQKILLITAIPDLIDSLLASHLHIVKVFRIF